MILDKENEFSDAQAVTATAASTNVIDLTVAGDAIDGEAYLVVAVQTTMLASAGAASLIASLETSTDEAFTSPVVLFTSAAVAKSALVAGYVLARVRIPVGVLRYLRVKYTKVTNDFSAGNMDAFITKQFDLRQP